MSGQQADITQRLQDLVARNFRFATNRDTAGTVVALIGVRVHHGVIDIVVLYGEHDADATRIPADEADILFPRTILWRTTGSASQVIDHMLALSVPVHAVPDTPHRHGSWMPTGPGRWPGSPLASRTTNRADQPLPDADRDTARHAMSRAMNTTT